MPKESLARGVVRGTGFPRHRPYKTSILYDMNPLCPSIMTSSIGVNDWFLSWRQLRNSVLQHRIYQIRIRGCSYLPADRHSIQAINHRRKIYFSSFDGKLCDVCEPLLIRFICMKIAVNEVLRCLAQFSLIGVIFAFSAYLDEKFLLLHNSADNLLGDSDSLSFQNTMNLSISVDTPVFMKEFYDSIP